MLFLVEIDLHSSEKRKAIEAFELRGPNRNVGVVFRNAWIGTRENKVYVLVESAEESLVHQACQAWGEYSEHRIHPVIDIEHY